MRSFKIIVKQASTKEGKKFNTFKTTTKNGRLIDVKFRQTVKNIPDKNCYVIVPDDKCHLNASLEYPVLWIEEVAEIKALDEMTAEANKKKLDEWFGE